jgi:hypothetical protein
VAAFVAALLVRVSGGMSIETDNGWLGFGALVPYPELFAGWLPGAPADWYDPVRATLFPVKTLSALTGLILLPVVSRLTARWDPPRALDRN